MRGEERGEWRVESGEWERVDRGKRYRLCGCVAVWLCGCAAVWLCGCVAVWLCGCFFVAAWLWIRVFGSRAERGASGARKAISAVCDCVVCGGAAVWLCAV